MHGSTVLVTGGTGGLGRAVVQELLDAGYDVTVADRHGEPPPCLQEVAEEAAQRLRGHVLRRDRTQGLVGHQAGTGPSWDS